jgi:hypothetical protein
MGSLLKIVVGLGLIVWGGKELMDKKKTGSSSLSANGAAPVAKVEEKKETPAVHVTANPSTAA